MSAIKKTLIKLFSFEKLRPDQTTAPEETGNFIIDGNFDFDSVPICPACASRNIATFIYGKPRLSTKIVEGFESGKIISGGCMIRKTAPKWHCYNCKKDFGRLR